MRTSFHHQPEAQHHNLQLLTSWPADYPIYPGKTGKHLLAVSFTGFDVVDGARSRRRIAVR